MASTLTERYIAAAVSAIPPTSRHDVQVELEVSIADAVDARIAKGEQHSDAESAVLTELGDPEVLAAGYADRPLRLIGPRFYLTWLRLLKLLCVIIPIVAMGAVSLSEVLAESPLNVIISSVIATGFSAFIQVAFWVTLVFAVLERTGNNAKPTEWNLSRLPEIRKKGAGRGDVISSLVVLVVGITAVLWDQFRGLVIQHGDAFPLLNPGLWPWWIVGLLTLMAAQTVLVIAVYLAGRWTTMFALINTALALVFAISATALLISGNLINPEFISAVFTENGVDDNALRILATITYAGFIGISVWAIIDGWTKTARDNRH